MAQVLTCPLSLVYKRMSAVSFDELPEQSPLRPLQKFCEVVTYCHTLGMYAYAVEGDSISLAMPPSPDIVGDGERQWLHAGAVTALIDSACGMAVMHKLRKSQPIATLDLRVDFLRPLPADRVCYCRSECHRLTRNVAFIRSQVFIEGETEPAAESMASFMLLKPDVKPPSP